MALSRHPGLSLYFPWLPEREVSVREFKSTMSEPDHPLSGPAHLPGGRWRVAITAALLLCSLATTMAGGRSTHDQWSSAIPTRNGQSTDTKMFTVKFTSRQREDGFVNSNWPAVSCASSMNIEGKGYSLLHIKLKNEIQKRIEISVVTA